MEGDALSILSVRDFEGTVSKKSAYKPVIGKIFNYLDEYFKGNAPSLDFKINPKGSEFSLKVWENLLKIPYGKSKSYKDIANEVFADNPCPQTVGRAVGKNPILIIIPCHRVLGADFSLTGFSAGLDIKRRLLNHEGIYFKK